MDESKQSEQPLRSSSSIPIPSSSAPHPKRAKVDDDKMEDVDDSKDVDDEDSDEGESESNANGGANSGAAFGLFFGDDSSGEPDSTSGVPPPAPPLPGSSAGKPARDEEAERKRLDELMLKFGSPQDFNPMTSMSTLLC